MSVLSLRLDERLEKHLAQFAKISGKSRSALVRQALEEFLTSQRKKAYQVEIKKEAAMIAAEGLDEDFDARQQLAEEALVSVLGETDEGIWWEE